MSLVKLTAMLEIMRLTIIPHIFAFELAPIKDYGYVGLINLYLMQQVHAVSSRSELVFTERE